MTTVATDGNKKCSHCKTTKPVTEFSTHRRASDGLRTWCRDCCAEHAAIHNSGRIGRRKKTVADETNTSWMRRAACRWEDPELFFPTGNTGPALLQIEEAKAVCRHYCPEVAACLEWALATGQDHGVLGGMSEDERRALKRRAARNRARASA